MIISFSGTSGSGKSVIISQILKSGILKGRKVIVREEDSFITIKLLKKILGENIFSKYKDEKFFKRQYNDIFYKFFSSLTYICYPLVVYFEFLIEYFRYQIIFKEVILLGDRFLYDYAVIFKNILEIDNKFVQWLYNHSPRPYLSFLIDINLNTALLRNKNNIPGKITSNSNKSFHQNILTQYHEIARKHKVLVIDNNGYLKDTVRIMKTHVISKEKLMNAKRIALCGLDGAGKTTIANMLAEYATSLNTKAKVVHFYHQNLLFKLLRLLGFYRIDEPKELIYQRSRERSAKERLKTTPFIMALLRFFDSYVQYLFSVFINKDTLIIFDRYFYDYIVSFEYLNIKPRAFFSRIIPSVEHKFLLDVTPATATRRKPESVKEFFFECHEIYLKVAREQNIKIVNTENKKPKAIMQQLIESID